VSQRRTLFHLARHRVALQNLIVRRPQGARPLTLPVPTPSHLTVTGTTRECAGCNCGKFRVYFR
jgi:hypothetical protein